MRTNCVFLSQIFIGLLVHCQSVNYCPPEGMLHTTLTGDQICYYGILGYGDYNQASQNCETAGGLLAEIPDQSAQNAVFYYVQLKGLNGWAVWIGYRTDTSSNLLKQDDTIQSDYNNFIAGEPASHVTECVHLCDANTGEWCASTCSTPHQALCSIQYIADPPETTTVLTTLPTTTDETTVVPTTHSTETLTTSTANQCTLLGGFVQGGYCYWMAPNYYSFAEADVACMLDGGSLAQMNDLYSLHSVYQSITDRGYHTESIWIGYIVIDMFTDIYRYSLDCILQPWSYYVSNFNVVDDCVSLQADSGGMMSSDFCTTHKKALCFNKTIDMLATCDLTPESTTSAESTITEITASMVTTTTSETTTTTTTAPPSTTTSSETTTTTVPPSTTTTSTTPPATSSLLPPLAAAPTATTTTQSTTSGQNTGTTGPSEICVCHCDGNEKSTINVTAEDLVRALSVNKSSLSSVRRSKTSADDPRPSARYLGSVGIAMLSVVFGLLIVLDAFRFFA